MGDGMPVTIDGLLTEPRRRASGGAYPGRFTCHHVQWTETGAQQSATFVLTAREIADAAESRLVWTDQDVQRGIKPGLPYPAERELPLCDGYPDLNTYVFDPEKADDIALKLLEGEQLFLNPLIWNLRPGSFSAYWNETVGDLYLYSGRIYLPDSHHRHQAILKAVRAFDDDPTEYPRFSPEMEFRVELYFLSKLDEGNYFFDKNQRPKPTAKSKAYDLTTQDDLSLLAKRVIDKSQALHHNVNRVTDKLTATNYQVVTLSTLRQMMQLFAPGDALDETEIEGFAQVAATFYDMLAEARPELAVLELPDRREVRRESLVDSAVMMFGYASLMRDFNAVIADEGLARAKESWRLRLARLSGDYEFKSWHGDFFARTNPLWLATGILKPGKNPGKLTLSNTGATRAQAGRVLSQLLSLETVPRDIQFLATR